MKKDINIKGIPARDLAFKGMEYVADAVESSMGPFGLNFLLEKGDKVTNDGKLISTALCGSIDNEFERRGALLGLKASTKAEELTKDGSSATWSLLRAISKESLRFLPSEKSIKAKKMPSEITKMIDEGKNEIIDKLKEMAKPVESKEELIKSALVSVENEQIANLLGSMQWDLGAEGVIIAEEVNETECSIERVNGLRLDNGFSSSGFVTNPETMSLEINDMPVILTNYTIGVEEILKLKELVFTPLINQKRRGVALFARAFTSEAIKLCTESAQTGFTIFPINAPYTNQNQVMKDMEAVVGGTFINVEGKTFDDIYATDVGFAKKLIAQQFGAVITGTDDEHSKERIAKRLETLTKSLEGEKSDFGKDMLSTRIAQLSNGFAILKVGAYSIAERKRLKDKCDDAVGAVRHALKYGTVKGAGLAFKEISETLSEGNILKRPICRINDVIMNSAPEGFVIEDWVRDPFLVLKVALEQACDYAKVFSTINGIVTTQDKKPKDEEVEE